MFYCVNIYIVVLDETVTDLNKHMKVKNECVNKIVCAFAIQGFAYIVRKESENKVCIVTVCRTSSVCRTSIMCRTCNMCRTSNM